MSTLNQFEKFFCSIDNEEITKQGVVLTDDGKRSLCIKHYHLSHCKQKESDCEQWHD